MSMCTDSNSFIILHGRQCMKFPLSSTQDMKEGWKDRSHPCGHWKDVGTFPPPNTKELGMCVMVNWYPPALSISLDSEEGEGRVQWKGLKCRVRCGMCGVL